MRTKRQKQATAKRKKAEKNVLNRFPGNLKSQKKAMDSYYNSVITEALANGGF